MPAGTRWSLALLPLVFGCTLSVSGPVVVRSSTGQVLTGIFRATGSDGEFSVSDGRLTCGGKYNSFLSDRTIQVPVACSDGRRGTATLTRENGLDGHGNVHLDDGTAADVIFGRRAEHYRFGAVTAPYAPRQSSPVLSASTLAPSSAGRSSDAVSQQEDRLFQEYSRCVVERAVGFARTTSEPAATVVRAAIASCREVARRLPPDAQDVARRVLEERVILLVIGERARPEKRLPTPAAPSPRGTDQEA